MTRDGVAHVLAAAAIVGGALLVGTAAARDDRSTLAERVAALGRDAQWTLVDSIPVKFRTFHPQGMVKIGDVFLVSSVEVRVPTKRLATPAGGYDRDTGEGVGHLFKIGRDGKLLADLTLGEGSIYHPGGIDHDGTSVWVPVAEYRPNGRSIIYRVAPDTMTATKILSFNDHIGGIVHDVATHTLHGVSWGSRRFYRWTLDDTGRVSSADATPESLRRLNPSHYVDYQDCKSVARERMLCTGLAELRGPSSFRLGGLELIDLEAGRPIHQVPLLLWTPDGRPMTQNPTWFEPTDAGIRGYFMPDDDTSTIYVYDAKTR